MQDKKWDNEEISGTKDSTRDRIKDGTRNTTKDGTRDETGNETRGQTRDCTKSGTKDKTKNGITNETKAGTRDETRRDGPGDETRNELLKMRQKMGQETREQKDNKNYCNIPFICCSKNLLKILHPNNLIKGNLTPSLPQD